MLPPIPAKGAAELTAITSHTAAIEADEDRVGAEAQRGRGGKKGKGKRKGDGKGKRKDACTKAGTTPKRGKPCCKGLIRDGAGHCAAAPTAGCQSPHLR